MDVKHGDGDTYQCDECPKTTNHKYALQVYKRKYHKILASDKQKCGKCDFSTTLKVRMVQHQGREHNVTINRMQGMRLHLEVQESCGRSRDDET